jgi:hypothetical protein
MGYRRPLLLNLVWLDSRYLPLVECEMSRHGSGLTPSERTAVLRSGPGLGPGLNDFPIWTRVKT